MIPATYEMNKVGSNVWPTTCDDLNTAVSRAPNILAKGIAG